MKLFDQIAAALVLTGTGGVVAWRAFRAWREFRMQRRALDLMVRSVTDAPKQERERTTR